MVDARHRAIIRDGSSERSVLPSYQLDLGYIPHICTIVNSACGIRRQMGKYTTLLLAGTILPVSEETNGYMYTFTSTQPKNAAVNM